MMKIKQYIFSALMLVLVQQIGFAQNGEPELAPDRKAAIDSLALEKVRDLSKYISIIGDKATPFSAKVVFFTST